MSSEYNSTKINLDYATVAKDLAKYTKSKTIIKDFISHFYKKQVDVKEYNSEKAKFIKYFTSPKKFKFLPLTVDYLAANIGKEIDYFYASSGVSPNGAFGPMDGGSVEKCLSYNHVFSSSFVPTPDLLIKVYDKNATVLTRDIPHREIIYKDFLSLPKPEREKIIKMRHNTPFYILGKMTTTEDPNFEWDQMQINQPCRVEGKIIRQMTDTTGTANWIYGGLANKK